MDTSRLKPVYVHHINLGVCPSDRGKTRPKSRLAMSILIIYRYSPELRTQCRVSTFYLYGMDQSYLEVKEVHFTKLGVYTWNWQWTQPNQKMDMSILPFTNLGVIMKLALDSSTMEGFIQVEVNSYNGIAHWWSPFSYFRGSETYNGLYLSGRVHFEKEMDPRNWQFGRVNITNLEVVTHNGLFLRGRVHFEKEGVEYPKLTHNGLFLSGSPFRQLEGVNIGNGLCQVGRVHITNFGVMKNVIDYLSRRVHFDEGGR